MVFDTVEEQDGEDYYVVTLSFRPEGNFSGKPGVEQFFIEKEGTIVRRQVRGLPSQGGWRRFGVVPIVVGVVAVAGAAVIGVALASGGEPDEPVTPTASVIPTKTPAATPATTTGPTEAPAAVPIVVPRSRTAPSFVIDGTATTGPGTAVGAPPAGTTPTPSGAIRPAYCSGQRRVQVKRPKLRDQVMRIVSTAQHCSNFRIGEMFTSGAVMNYNAYNSRRCPGRSADLQARPPV